MTYIISRRKIRCKSSHISQICSSNLYVSASFTLHNFSVLPSEGPSVLSRLEAYGAAASQFQMQK